MKAIIKWTNKYSKETGYVGSVSTKNRCFYNAPEKSGAKIYESERAANRAMKTISGYGEAENNDFEIEAI